MRTVLQNVCLMFILCISNCISNTVLMFTVVQEKGFACCHCSEILSSEYYIKSHMAIQHHLIVSGLTLLGHSYYVPSLIVMFNIP